MTKRPTYGIHSLQGNGGKRYDGSNTSKNVTEVGHWPHKEIRLTQVQYCINRYYVLVVGGGNG